METPITYESSSKFRLSIGFLLLIGSFSILYFKFDELNNIEIISILLLIILAVSLIRQSLTEIEKIESAERRYKQELTVSEIIKQDLLLIDKEFKEIDHNKKIERYNKKNPEYPKGYVHLRKIDAIVRQALNPEFYDAYYMQSIFATKVGNIITLTDRFQKAIKGD